MPSNGQSLFIKAGVENNFVFSREDNFVGVSLSLRVGRRVSSNKVELVDSFPCSIVDNTASATVKIDVVGVYESVLVMTNISDSSITDAPDGPLIHVEPIPELTD